MSCFVCSYLTDCCKRVGPRVRACCNTSLSRGFLLQMQSHNSPYLPTPVCMMVLFQWTTLLKQLIQGEAKRFLNIYIAWTVHYTLYVMYWVNPCVDSYMPRKPAEMEHIMVNLKQSAAQLFSLLCCGFALPVMLSCGACGFTQARVTTRTLPIPPEHAGMPVLSVYMCDLAEGQGIMWNWPEVNTLIRWKPWGKAAQVVERESDPPCLSATGSPVPSLHLWFGLEWGAAVPCAFVQDFVCDVVTSFPLVLSVVATRFAYSELHSKTLSIKLDKFWRCWVQAFACTWFWEDQPGQEQQWCTLYKPGTTITP